MFEIQFTPTIIALSGGLTLSVLYLLIGFRHYIASVSRKVETDNSQPLPDATASYPPVSVIVYSEDDAANLEILLPQILEQDYPSQFEVIVVNDGAISATNDVISRLEHRYSNLYMTFTPMESRSLSRKKLAVTLGIKAARFDIIIHTTGNCQVPSKTWLRAMARNFSETTEIVIGYAAPTPQGDIVERNKRLHAFDSVRTAIEYLSWAIKGSPYRGDCCNLAYRRSTFFRNKGFSRSLNLKYGDDDVFISEVATQANTAVELSADSMLLRVDTDPTVVHRSNKLHYDYTAHYLKGHARLFFGSCSTMWWLSIACAITVALVGLPSLIPTIFAGILLMTTWITLMVTWRKASRSLWSRPLLFTVPWFISYHPIYTLYYNLKGYMKRKSNLTWG